MTGQNPSDHSRASKIRDAATIILLRDRSTSPRILMGQRGAQAAFMPSKFVFPGGAVDAQDKEVPLALPLSGVCAARLAQDADTVQPNALAAAAIRELWEETGLRLGCAGRWPAPVPSGWDRFSEAGCLPSADALQFVFRAITPPGRPRRFDARFFLADAAEIFGDPDDFSEASDELSHLQWVPIEAVRSFDMPFITQVVLAEVAARLHTTAAPTSVPFFKNSDEESLFRRLGGRGPDVSSPEQAK